MIRYLKDPGMFFRSFYLPSSVPSFPYPPTVPGEPPGVSVSPPGVPFVPALLPPPPPKIVFAKGVSAAPTKPKPKPEPIPPGTPLPSRDINPVDGGMLVATTPPGSVAALSGWREDSEALGHVPRGQQADWVPPFCSNRVSFPWSYVGALAGDSSPWIRHYGRGAMEKYNDAVDVIKESLASGKDPTGPLQSGGMMGTLKRFRLINGVCGPAHCNVFPGMENCPNYQPGAQTPEGYTPSSSGSGATASSHDPSSGEIELFEETGEFWDALSMPVYGSVQVWHLLAGGAGLIAAMWLIRALRG